MTYSLGRRIVGLKPHVSSGISKLSWVGRKPSSLSTSAKCNAGEVLLPPCHGGAVNALCLKEYALKRKGSLRNFDRRNKSIWDARWAMHSNTKSIGQYTFTSTSTFRSGMDYTKEEDDKKTSALQATERTIDEDGVGDTFNQVAVLRDIEEALGSPLDSGPQVPAPKPLIIVISGPSGVGKDAVVKRLQEVRKGIHFVVTATTRAKRLGEVDGKDYFFVSKEHFLSLIEKNELLEYATVYGDYKGIPKQQIRDFMSKGYDIVLRVDVQGAATLRAILGNSALFIFLVAESEVALVKRLMDRRTETREKLLLRVSTAREEVKRMIEFDYVAVNAQGQLEKTVNLINSIIDAEKAKVQQRMVEI